MKLRLIACALIATTISLPLAAMWGWLSSEQKPVVKLKIATAEKLKRRAEESLLSSDVLEKSKFLEIFADKELSLTDLQNGITILETNFWTHLKQEGTQQIGYYAFLAMTPVISYQFKSEMAQARPRFYQLLLAEDYPNELAQIPEYAAYIESKKPSNQASQETEK